MVAAAAGQPSGEASQQTYASLLRSSTEERRPVSLKPLTYLHGEPRVIWDQSEVEQIIVNENLQYVVVGKFSHRWSDIQELRRLIPKQCELKGECNRGLLTNRYVLIRATLMEDYINLLSKPIFYIAQQNWSYPMRTLKWDPMFDPEEETSTTIAWISFPSLPPNFFGNETLFSMAAAVGKPLQVDMAMKNKTRPSCARVKVEVDLLSELPKRISIGMRQPNGNVQEKWIKIKYDYIPKYCTTCMIQGHDEKQCYVNHPDLHPARQKEKTMEIEKWQEKRGHVKKKTNQVWNKVGVTTTNKYDAFQEKDEDYVDTEQQENIKRYGSRMGQRRNKHITKEVDEDEGLNENINYINEVGDLSPRHVDGLKKGIRKGKYIIPLQVRTRSNKESILAIDQ
ncbi:uncharacterized protein LOC125858913 [Solanum stenotomum]|uniref:uncharacterized protein LOC125858913 n=1 Tax=Solanum stenotomum TaxID=172797 RepID=UPI0020D0CAF5|nr:uncharacterized protein LOC125858913 [Solanum stenotomum]